MNLLDLNTAIVSQGVINVVCILVMLLLWLQNRRRFAGLDFWLANFVLQGVANALIALRGRIPGIFSVVVANTLIIGAVILLYIGLEHFTGKRGPQIHNYLLLAVFTGVHTCFTFAWPSLAARVINFSLAMLLLCAQCAWLTLGRVSPGVRPVARWVGVIFGGYGVISIVRILTILLMPPGDDLFKSNFLDALLLLLNQVLFIGLTFGLSLMVNGRLFAELENDIAEHKKTEEALQQSENRFRALVEKGADAITLLGADGRIKYEGPTVERLTGHSMQDRIGKNGFGNVHPDDIPVVRAAFVSVLINPGSSQSALFRSVRKDGSMWWTEGTATNLLNEPGVEAIVVNYRDVTERKQAERTTESLAKFPSENPNPILRIHQDGTLMYTNDAGYQLLPDWKLAIGQRAPEVLQQAVCETLEQQTAQLVETTQRGRVISLFVVPIAEAGYANLYGRDITEREQAEKEREQLLSELEHKNKELEAIVYVASHDLRSPLVNIQGFGRNLRKYFGQVSDILERSGSLDDFRTAVQTIFSERIPNALRFVETSSAKMDTLIDGLLRISRIGRAQLQLGPVDMQLMIQNIIESAAFQIEKADAQVIVDGSLVACYGDKNQLNQVFSNLLDNALKYRVADRPLTVTFSSRVAAQKVCYTVADSGLGIAPQDQEKIWEVFRRLEDDPSISGEGLGLAIARRIIERHNGRIWVESQPGIGSQFFIELPAVA